MFAKGDDLSARNLYPFLSKDAARDCNAVLRDDCAHLFTKSDRGRLAPLPAFRDWVVAGGFEPETEKPFPALEKV